MEEQNLPKGGGADFLFAKRREIRRRRTRVRAVSVCLSSYEAMPIGSVLAEGMGLSWSFALGWRNVPWRAVDVNRPVTPLVRSWCGAGPLALKFSEIL